jgi:hypothetical protein
VPSDNPRYLSAASTAHVAIPRLLLVNAALHARARPGLDLSGLQVFRRLRLNQPMAHQPPFERGHLAPNLARNDKMRQVTHDNAFSNALVFQCEGEFFCHGCAIPWSKKLQLEDFLYYKYFSKNYLTC